jgi:TonB-linked SusC/RagA family outer membrane protein
MKKVIEKWRQQNHDFFRFNLVVLFFITFVPVTQAQDVMEKSINVHMNATTIKDFFDEMNRQTGLNFIYNADQIKSLPKINVNEHKNKVRNILNNVISSINCKYDVKGSIIIVSRKQMNDKTRIIYGNIRDENGDVLPGVSIRIKGTDLNTITDDNGYYKLKAPTWKCTINYSYIGMTEQFVTIEKGNYDFHKNIRLTSDNKLDEIVVTGYQTISKERATGAYTIIKSKDLVKRHANNLAQALDGLAAGMQGNDDGRGGKKFTIRGTSTMLADNTPLVVVDGFPITDNPSSNASTNPNLNALERINPNDVESITLLKDAAAASIWGARSTNGVIVITTKKAKKGQPWSVEAKTQLSISFKQDVSHLTNSASSKQMINYERWCFENDMLGEEYTGSMSSLFNAINESQLIMYKGYKWGTLSKDEMNNQLEALSNIDNRNQIKKYLLKAPIFSQSDFSISGGLNNWTTRASVEYQYETGNFIGSRDNNWKIDWNNNYKLNNHITFNAGFNLTNSNQHSSQLGINDLTNLSPYELLLNEDGSYATNWHSSYNTDVLSRYKWEGFTYKDMDYNMLQEALTRKQRTSNTQMRTQLGMEVKIIDGLRFNSKFQYESSNYTQCKTNKAESFYTRYTVNYYTPGDMNGNATGISAIPSGDIIVNEKGSGHSALFRNDFSFDKILGKRHAISAVLGNEISNYYIDSYIKPYSYGITSTSTGITGKAEYVKTMDGSTSMISGVPSNGKEYIAKTWYHNRFVSFYANASYMYDERYGISASARSDASNLITNEPKYRWSPLWSIGGMWNVTNESWMKEQKIMNRLTLRVTYGKNGNAASTSSARTTINTNATDVDESTGLYPGSISDYGNPSLRWEKTATTNIGLDFSSLNNHIYGSIEYYNKKSTDVLGNVSIASVYGTSSATFNNASINNRGFELSLGASDDIGDFAVSGNITYAYNKNKVTKLYNEITNVSDLLNSYYIPGYAMGALFTFDYAGMKDGIPCIYDNDGNQIPITDGSIWYMDHQKLLHYQGTTVSPHTIGINLGLQWKYITLNAYMNGRFGGKMLMPTFNYLYIDNYGGKRGVSAQIADLMDANGNIITNLTNNMVLPTTDGSGNAITANQYNNWFFFNHSLNTRIESSSYIYLSEIDINCTLPDKLFYNKMIKGVDLYGKLENVGLLWSANSKHYNPNYLPGCYQPMLTFTLGASIKF